MSWNAPIEMTTRKADNTLAFLRRNLHSCPRATKEKKKKKKLVPQADNRGYKLRYFMVSACAKDWDMEALLLPFLYITLSGALKGSCLILSLITIM